MNGNEAPTNLSFGQVVLLLGIPWLAYFPVLDLGWLYDDAFNLLYVLKHPASAYITSPDAWRQLPFAMYTPLQMMSYEADLFVWGLAPVAFYIHNLVALSLVGVSFWLALRTWVADWAAALGALLFVLGPTSSVMAQQIMIRHYTEGFFFFFLALLLWRQRRTWRFGVALSALAFGASLFCKEFFVAGLAVFFFDSQGKLVERIRHIAPHIGILVLYAGVRSWMLGELGGSYGWHVAPEDLPLLAVTVLPRITGVLFLELWPGWLALGIWIAWRGEGKILIAALILALLACLPFVPVSTVIDSRYTLPLWAVISFAIAMVASGLHGRRAFALGAASLALALVSNRIDFSERMNLSRQMTVEQRVDGSVPVSAALRNPAAPPATMRSLIELSGITGERSFGDWFQDDISLCDGEIRGDVFEYDERDRALERRNVQALKTDVCPRYREESIDIELWREGDGVLWSFGPWRNGEWLVMVEDHTSVWAVPPEGGFFFPDVDHLRLRVGFRSEDGWASWTPWMDADISKGSWP